MPPHPPARLQQGSYRHDAYRRAMEAPRPPSSPRPGFSPARSSPSPAFGPPTRRPGALPGGPPPLLRVVVQVPECRLIFGEQLILVGAAEELGAWDVWRAPRMVWQEGDSWAVEVALPAGQVRGWESRHWRGAVGRNEKGDVAVNSEQGARLPEVALTCSQMLKRAAIRSWTPCCCLMVL